MENWGGGLGGRLVWSERGVPSKIREANHAYTLNHLDEVIDVRVRVEYSARHTSVHTYEGSYTDNHTYYFPVLLSRRRFTLP